MFPDRTSESASYPPISDYALIGHCRSAGLISQDGSLEWLCLPRFDGPSVFAAILDAGGHIPWFRMRPHLAQCLFTRVRERWILGTSPVRRS
jgi:GH15 family glucan-1,4-alpha-glucosidase